jgi:hypothetical protein
MDVPIKVQRTLPDKKHFLESISFLYSIVELVDMQKMVYRKSSFHKGFVLLQLIYYLYCHRNMHGTNSKMYTLNKNRFLGNPQKKVSGVF